VGALHAPNPNSPHTTHTTTLTKQSNTNQTKARQPQTSIPKHPIYLHLHLYLYNNREIAEYAHVTIEYVRRTQTKALQRLRTADTYRILEAFVHGQVRGLIGWGVCVYMHREKKREMDGWMGVCVVR
jgi:hypothetical protein